MSQLTLAAAVVVAVLVVAGIADAEALGEGLAEAPSAVSPRLVTAECPLTAITTPIAKARATGMATTITRAEGFLRMRRRHANRNLLSMGSDTSVSESPQQCGALDLLGGHEAEILKILWLASLRTIFVGAAAVRASRPASQRRHTSRP